MSVVGQDWEAMKRYNIHELYLAASKSAADSEEPRKPEEGGEESRPEAGEENNVQPTA